MLKAGSMIRMIATNLIGVEIELIRNMSSQDLTNATIQAAFVIRDPAIPGIDHQDTEILEETSEMNLVPQLDSPQSPIQPELQTAQALTEATVNQLLAVITMLKTSQRLVF